LAFTTSRSANKESATPWTNFHNSDELAPLDSKPKASEEVTDSYLADLAAKHVLKFGTLDGGIKHPTAELIA
jgi:hypothetical protein